MWYSAQSVTEENEFDLASIFYFVIPALCREQTVTKWIELLEVSYQIS